MDDTQDQPVTPRSSRQHAKARAREGAVNWVRDTTAGAAQAAVVVLVGMVAVQLGLVAQGQQFEFSLFTPYEFWQSFSGLVVTWSQWNEWLLLGLGAAALAVTLAAAFFWWRSRGDTPQDEQQPILERLENSFASLRTVTALGILAGSLFGAYFYQQYLWNVKLPVPRDQVGIAFTRQIGSTVASDQLADKLRQMGHEGKIAMRELPVSFDARDTDAARAMAKRIGAEAVIIYREEAAAAATTSVGKAATGLGAPAAQAAAPGHVAYIVFADPSLGVQIPVPQRTPDGKVTSVTYRTKEGVEIPRIEAGDVSRLMEAAAGILLYDQDRYLPAIAHLRNAMPKSGEATDSDPLVSYYLGNAYYLIQQDENAQKAMDNTIKMYEARQSLGVQDKLLLASAYNQRGNDMLYSDKVDDAERLLKKAVALREPLAKDESALADPTTYRRMHETFGTTYLSLMDVAEYKKDGDAAALWKKRSGDEAQALSTISGDKRAQTTAIWMLYRVGSCEDAYKQVYDLLAKDPNNVDAHRLAERLAGLRDKSFLSLEVKQHIDALLRIDPKSLPDLQSLLTYYNLSTYLNDPSYVSKVREVADRILEVDPNNVEALDAYVGTAESVGGWQSFNDPYNGIFNVGHAPTYTALSERWARDPKVVKQIQTDLAAARPYITRWKEETQPDSIQPLLYAARLSERADNAVYGYLYVYSPDKQDPELKAAYPDIWAKAVKDSNDALSSGRPATARQKATIRLSLNNLWLHKYWVSFAEKNPAGQKEAVEQALSQAEQAVALVKDTPPTNSDEQYTDASVHLNYGITAITASSYYSTAGDSAQAARYKELYASEFQKWQDISSLNLKQIQTSAEFLDRVICPGGEDLTKGQQAQATNPTESVQLLTRYVTNYPNDPSGVLSLGWAQYLNGQYDEALATTQKFETMAPDEPYGPGNRGSILLALNRPQEADQAYAAALEKLSAEPLGVRLNHLSSLTVDLVDLGRDRPGARTGLRASLPRFARYIDALPAEAGYEWGSKSIVAINNLGAAAIWAGDYALAEKVFAQGLAISPNFALMHANLGLTKLLQKDPAAAQAEYDKAIAAAESYVADSEGKRVEGNDWKQRSAVAKSELEGSATALEVIAKQQPALAPAVQPFIQKLQTAAKQYEAGAS